MNLVCFGQQNWDHCWTGKQQLLTRMARRGHRILYVDPDWRQEPRDLPDEVRSLVAAHPPGLRELGPGALYGYTHPFLPSLGWRLNVRLHRQLLARLTRTLHLPQATALALRPDQRERVDAVRPAARVYFAADEWTAFPGYGEQERRRLREEEEESLRQSDLALAVSPRLVQRLRTLQPRTWLLESGADVEHFSPLRLSRALPDPQVGELPRPRLGFIGQVDERLDLELLEDLARARPDWQLALVGRQRIGADLSVLEELPNVHMLGYRPYEDLPGVLRGLDVCLLPYRRNELTDSCSPLKVFEYLASGLPVVAAPLAGLGSAAEVVVQVQGVRAWIEAIGAALADPARGREERLAVARRSSWEHRVDELEARLEEARELARAARGDVPRPATLGLRRLDALPDPPSRFGEYGQDLTGERPSALARAAFHATRVAGGAAYALRRAGRVLRGRPAKVRSVLVVRHAQLGDVLALVPGLKALRARYPRARVVLGVQEGGRTGDLLQLAGLVDEVRELAWMGRASRAAQVRGLAELLLQGFDAVVSGEEYFLRREGFFAGAPHRVGVFDGHPLQRWNRRLLPLDRTRHEADASRDLVDALPGPAGPDAGSTPPEDAFGLDLDPGRLRDAREDLRRMLCVPAGARLLVCHPGGAKPTRRWPIERFAELASTLLRERPDLHLAICGSAGELELARDLRERVPAPARSRVHDLAGRTGLLQLAALLQGADLFLGDDSGPMHLARALGTPLVALLGPENDRRWGPYPSGRAPAVLLRHVVPCAPCSLTRCQAHHCMRRLSVESVLREVRALLDRRRGAPRGGKLRRILVHEDWDSLASAGFALPLVSVLVWPSRPASEVEGQLVARGLADQAYPALEVLLPLEADEERRLPALEAELAAWTAATGVPVRTVALPSGTDVRRRWSALLAACRGELVAVLPHAPGWASDRLAAHVAVLTRHPEADHARSVTPTLQRGRRRAARRPFADPTARVGALVARLEAVGDLPAATERSLEELLAALARGGARLRGTSSDSLPAGARRGGERTAHSRVVAGAGRREAVRT